MSGTLDVTKYVKRDYKEIESFIKLLSEPKNITRTLLTNTFGNKKEYKSDGKFKIIPPVYNITDYFDLPAGVLKNQPMTVKDTTFGIFIFNSLVINNAFHGKVGYQNISMDGDNFDKFQSKIGENLLNGNLTVEEFGEYCNTIVWLGYFTELFMPGFSLDLAHPNPKIMAMKNKIIKENPEMFSKTHHSSDDIPFYSNDVEKPLINAVKEEFKDNPSLRLFNLGKPNLGNQYKNSCITNGPLIDPVTGKYKFNTNSYSEGVDLDMYDALANKSMSASFSRSVATAFGGTWSKYLSVAMQNVVLGPKGSDCGTTKTLEVVIDKEHAGAFKYNYCIVNGKKILMTPEFIANNMGKQVQMRVPIFCKSQTICNTCMGDMLYRLGIINAGLVSSVATGKQMNLSMKRMHDVTIKTIKVNIMDDTDFIN